MRIEDALADTRAAVEEGIVAGGGSALAYATKSLNSIKGSNDISDALAVGICHFNQNKYI